MPDQPMPNPFAPPVANVADPVPMDVNEMVEATRLSRFLAFLIDCLPYFIVGILAAIVAGTVIATNGTGSVGSLIAAFGVFGLVAVVAVVGWLVYNAVLVYRYGQIFGKRMMGIRVVRTDGSRVTFARFILLRWLPLALLGWVVGKVIGGGHGLWPYLVVLVDTLFIFRATRQCLHDSIADTKVVTAASSESATLAGDVYPTLRNFNA